MIAQEAQDKLSEYGIDVSKLIEAAKSEVEVSLDVPTLYTEKGISEVDKITFGKNRFDEGKIAAEEILAKITHDKYGLDLIDGKEGRKNMDKVAEAIKAKFSKPSDNKELEGNFKALQDKFEASQNEIESIKTTHATEVFASGLRQSLTGLVPNDSSIGADDAVDLYLMKHNLKNENGRAVIEVNGEIQKDTLLNPVQVNDHFKSWLDSKGVVAKSGMGGTDSKSGGSTAKFKSTKEFYQYAVANNIDANSPAGMKFLSENKATDFKY